MRRLRAVLTSLGLAALGGSIAWGLLGDAAAAQDRALLTEIQRAETSIAFSARRVLTAYHPDGAVTTVLDVKGRDGRRGVKFVEARLPDGEVRRPPERPSEPGKKPKRPEAGPFSWMGRLRGIASGRDHAGMMARFEQPDVLLRNYRLDRQGRDVVAGRQADRFELRPIYPGRAAYRLWADAERRLLLRFQVVSPADTVVFDVSHESIVFDPAFGPDDFAPFAPRERGGERAGTPPRFHKELLKSQEDLRAVPFYVWLPDRLPAGFERRSIEVVRAKDHEGVLARYSDGMATLMVMEFETNNPIWQRMRLFVPGFGPSDNDELTARRLTHPGGTMMNVTLGGTEVVATGQVDGEEMERMIRSLRKVN